MFVRTEELLGVGMGLVLNVRDPTSHKAFRIDCVVRRRVFGSNAKIAVDFVEMTEPAWLALSEFLRPAALQHSIRSGR
jgi:hypothetical protein